MQIIGPDGTPIETLDQLPPASTELHPQPAPAQRPALPSFASLRSGRQLTEQHAPVPIPTRAPSTTIDALEREFQRKKQRELDHGPRRRQRHRTNGNAPRVTGEKVGRNDPCPCGSGKKYKKCHGAEA